MFQSASICNWQSRPTRSYKVTSVLALSLLMTTVAMLVPGCKKTGQTSGTNGSQAVTSSDPVVLYCSVDQEYGEQLIAAFHKLHPNIKVAARYDTEATKTTGLVERMRTEKDSPQADIYWSSEIFLTQKLADEGILRPWTSVVASHWPANLKDPKNRWYAFAGRARVVAYNKTRVKDPPKYWKDLADPKYKDRVVMADPNYGTTRGAVATWFTLWGTDEATKFLEALKANDVRIVQSNSQAVRQVVDGLADFAMADGDDVWAQIRNGHDDLALVYPRHGDGPGMGTLITPNTIGMLANRPDRPEADLLADFLLSQQTEQMLYDSDSHNIPLRYADKIKVDPKYQVPDPLKIDYTADAGSMTTAMDAVNRILLSRGN